MVLTKTIKTEWFLFFVILKPWEREGGNVMEWKQSWERDMCLVPV
jgi:hypothetical protein